MKKKSSLFYFLFTLLNSLACSGIPLISYAATVIITENVITPASQSKIQNNIALFSRTENNKVKFPSPSNNKIAKKSIFESGINYIIDNEDNTFIQDSLNAFSQTKQLIDETDTTINIMTQDLLLTFGIDQYIHNELIVLQINGSNNLELSKQFSATHFKKQKFNDLLTTLKNKEKKQIHNEVDNSLVGKILRIKNLYFLAGAMVFVSVLKRILNFILLGKHK